MLSGRQLGASLFVSFFSLLLLSSTANAGLKWQYHADAPIVGNPIIYQGYAYALSESGSLFVLDMANGVQDYPFSIGQATHIAPAMGSRYLILASDAGNVTALDPLQKKKAWTYSASSKTISTISTTTGASQSYQAAVKQASGNFSLLAIANSGGVVFLSYSDHITAVDETTGKELWKREIIEGGMLAADDTNIYVQNGYNLAAFGKYSGAQLWNMPVGRTFMTSPNAISAKSKILVGNTDGQILSLDAKTGKPDWIYQAGGWIMSTPSLIGKSVIFGTNSNEAIALDAEGGMVRWKATLGGPVWSQALGAGDGMAAMAVFGANDNSIYALDMADGKQLWRYRTTDWAFGGATQDGKDVVFGSQDGEIWALTVSPMCTITNLEAGQLVGEKFEITGTSFAESGVGSTRVSAGGIEYPPIAGKTNWTVLADISALQEGNVQIKCSVTDVRGLEESGRNPKVTVAKSLRAPRRTMSVTAQTAEPGSTTKVFVRDADGFDLGELLVTVGDESYSNAKSPVEVKVPLKDGEYKVTAKKFGYEAAEGNLVVRTNIGPMLLLGAIVIIGIGAAAFVAVRMITKKEKKI